MTLGIRFRIRVFGGVIRERGGVGSLGGRGSGCGSGCGRR